MKNIIKATDYSIPSEIIINDDKTTPVNTWSAKKIEREITGKGFLHPFESCIDLDNFTETGKSLIVTNSTLNTPKPNMYGKVECSGIGSRWTIQTLFDIYDSSTYTRAKTISGEWSEWLECPTLDKLSKEFVSKSPSAETQTIYNGLNIRSDEDTYISLTDMDGSSLDVKRNRNSFIIENPKFKKTLEYNTESGTLTVGGRNVILESEDQKFFELNMDQFAISGTAKLVRNGGLVMLYFYNVAFGDQQAGKAVEHILDFSRVSLDKDVSSYYDKIIAPSVYNGTVNGQFEIDKNIIKFTTTSTTPMNGFISYVES